MSKEDLLAIIQAATNDLKAEDGYLLDVDVAEEAISHKFAEHLNARLRKHPEWQNERYAVDCEYNRDGIEPKIVPGHFWKCKEKKTYPYPDIIIHQRGSGRINLLAIEVKLTSNADPDEIAYAKWKLEAYKGHLGYHFSLYICFKTGAFFRHMVRNHPDDPCYEEMELL
jgi:hypothetical protein